MSTGQFNHHQESRLAVHWRGDVTVVGTDQQVTFEVSEGAAIL
jgi:hypothetical protein